ncbi:hypothetical protein B0I35DRAFT_358295 [Stachybotrys elegans]|uniref:Zn(2)-C6 fungal-type domain-containing protein n=1 Tax=Stachybotrys elegans TaxID=80388 RepID=A0A8K0WP03_9HYPO|nr:hypothetical protein B0I35DRAFT_358295 [Stachybotrys elegans]
MQRVNARRVRRQHKRSCFGCRNCKLRRVKVICDETRPQCERCVAYGVLCNFEPGVSDLQPEDANCNSGQFRLRHGRLPLSSLAMPLICTDGVTSFEMDTECLSRLEQFRLRAICSFSTEMIKIWKHRIPHIAFRNPYLMHSVLAVAVAYQRYADMPERSRRTHAEIHHAQQCALLFRQKLLHPISSTDRDALWATAALLGMASMASSDAVSVEEAWPLGTSDLEWFRLTASKSIIWNLTDPLRPGGVFRPMAQEYDEMRIELPRSGVEGIPRVLIELCDLKCTSSPENSPYFAAAHLLAQLIERRGAGMQMVSFVCQSHASFLQLLDAKDPVALVLLATWYAVASDALWWIRRRVRVEYQAIQAYLERFHPVNGKVHSVLAWMRGLSGDLRGGTEIDE